MRNKKVCSFLMVLTLTLGGLHSAYADESGDTGVNVNPPSEREIDSYNKAAQQHRTAMLREYQKRYRADPSNESNAMQLADALFFGGLGDKDVKGAMTIYHRLIEQGSLQAMYRVGNLILTDNKAKRDPKMVARAEKLLTQAASKGSLPAVTELQYRYSTGSVLPKSDQKAAHWEKEFKRINGGAGKARR